MVASMDEQRYWISIPVRAVWVKNLSVLGMVLECAILAELLMTALIAKKASPVTIAPRSSRNSSRAAHASVVRSAAGSPIPDSVLRPYFTGQEITRAMAHGLRVSCLPRPAGLPSGPRARFERRRVPLSRL